MKLLDLATYLGGVAALIAIIVSIYKFYNWCYLKGASNSRNERKKEAFDNVYAPLRVALTETKYTICTSTCYPYFSQRLKRAVDEFNRYKFIKARFKHFYLALWDKKSTSHIECETHFPRKKIFNIIEKNPSLIEADLMNKIHELKGMSSAPWDYDDEDIVKFEYGLTNYLYQRYEELYEELHNKPLKQDSGVPPFYRYKI